MISGTVNAKREATILLQVRGRHGQERTIETIIDTGFNGFLTLPFAEITHLGLSPLGFGRAILADGSEALFEVYEALALWEGKRRIVQVNATESAALVGMSLLQGHTLRIDVVEGGRVVIEALT